MKCIKNIVTGEISRVLDKQANQMVGGSWMYIPKSEWKASKPKTEKQETEKIKKEKTVSEKSNRRAKLKQKQRK